MTPHSRPEIFVLEMSLRSRIILDDPIPDGRHLESLKNATSQQPYDQKNIEQ